LTVTVHIPAPLRNAVEGRRKLNLGLPPSADVGDLVQALLTLYPKLRAHVSQDLRAMPDGQKVQMKVLADPRMRKVYLVADQPRRLAI
jgi:molybdopterin converting factor small subunit